VSLVAPFVDVCFFIHRSPEGDDPVSKCLGHVHCPLVTTRHAFKLLVDH